jgi:hypothetical protein
VNSDTVASLLGELSEHGFSSYFRWGVLYCGMIHAHAQTGGMKQKFCEGERGNIIESSDLKWDNADDISLRIKASGTDAKGRVIRVEVGDKEGELRSFFKYNTTKEELEAEAKKRLTEWKVSGLSGSFTTFGARPVWLLDSIKVQMLDMNEALVYRVIKNTIRYGSDGYRQDITIEGKE